MRNLHHHGGIKISHIVKQYTQPTERNIYRRCKKQVNPELMQDKKKNIISKDHQNQMAEMREK